MAKQVSCSCVLVRIILFFAESCYDSLVFFFIKECSRSDGTMDYGDVVLGEAVSISTVLYSQKEKEIHSCLLLPASYSDWYKAVCLGRLFLLLCEETISLLLYHLVYVFIEMKALLTCRPFAAPREQFSVRREPQDV